MKMRMKLYFRELNRSDIPAIKEISKDIWGGDDYIPDVIERWLQEEDCMNYGGFLDEEAKEMVGLGRIKFFPNGVAWLEGGRVKISHQKQGIGRELLGYAIEYARKKGAKIAQYDTSSENLGSIALARYHGFEKKKSMAHLECKGEDLKIPNEILPDIKNITIEEAKAIYDKIDVGPGDEVCIGWSYVPIANLYDNGSSWYAKSNAILQKIEFDSQSANEGPKHNFIWMITYGDPNQCSDLIKHAILNEKNAKNVDLYEVFCNPEVVNLIKEFGFSYSGWETEKDDPKSVLLFEKHY